MSTRLAANPDTLIPYLRSQLGYSESPPNSNQTKYGEWYGMNRQPWCAIFDSYASYFSGNPLPAIRTTKGYAYVPDLLNYARARGQYKAVNSGYSPKPGDHVLFSFGGQRADHVGRVIQNLGNGSVRTIEGNTNGAGSRTGGSVLEKIRRAGIIGYASIDIIRPAIDWAAVRRMAAAKLREQYGATPNMGGGHKACCEVVALQQSLNLVTGAGLSEDGDYGPKTIQAVWNFQLFMNGLGCGIQDYPGTSHEGTRWWLCVILQDIRDGKS